MFFEREEKDGGGKVKEIYIDRINRYAMVEFEEAEGTKIKHFIIYLSNMLPILHR